MATTTQVLAGAKALQKHDIPYMKWSEISARLQIKTLEQSRVVLDAAEREGEKEHG